MRISQRILLMVYLSINPTILAEQPQGIINSIGMNLVLIPKGTFAMGSSPSEEGSKDDEHQHLVTISQDFYLGATEVTQAQYEKVMGATPSRFRGREIAQVTPAARHPRFGPSKFIAENQKIVFVDSSHYPVENVSWVAAMEFCKRMSDLPEEKSASRVYRLPTEAEWEYACRAGSKTAFSSADSAESLGDYAWFLGNSNLRTHPVGQKRPNAWGLYDMHGNVWEWCSDWYGEYPRHAVTDPKGPSEGSGRVRRGGSWITEATHCRQASRRKFDPTFSYYDVGFRVAVSPAR